MSINVKIYPKGPLDENTYLVTDEATGFSAVVDPGYYGEDIASDIGDISNLKYILLTHGHFDHYAACRDYLSDYPEAVFVVPEKDMHILYEGKENKWFALGNGDPVCPEAGRLVNEGDTVTLGESSLSVIETPGHTEGGICYICGIHAFTGDTLFRLSVGNTSFETGDWDTLVKSINEKLYTLPDDTIVYPGHGPVTQIEFEKRNNPFV
jgi:glyoxylase-like metal-dependent hydrolase (beta-lactamase superfamily II)